MLMQSEREQVVEYGKQMLSSGLTNGTTGNISVYNKEQDLMAISPSGVGYFETRPEDVVIMKLDGSIVDGALKPSSEYHLHAEVYIRKPDMGATVHTHSDHSAVMSCLRWDLPPVHYMIQSTGAWRVPCSRYETFGSADLAQSALDAMGSGKACFLANHGLLVCDITLAKAFALAEKVEWMAGLYLAGKAVGEPVNLTDVEMADVAERYKSYGQQPKAAQ